MRNENELQEIYELIFKKSKSFDTEILYDESESATTRFSNNVITQNLAQKNQAITIKVIDSHRVGIAETNHLDESSLYKTLAKAIYSAQIQTNKDDTLPLIKPQQYEKVNHFDEQAVFLSPSAKVKWIIKAVNKIKQKKFSAAGIASNSWTINSIANSNGLFAYQKQSDVNFNLSIDKDDSTGWYEQTSHQLNDIDVDYIIDKALKIGLSNHSPIDLEPGNYSVILSAEAVGELLFFLAFYGLNSQDIFEKGNYFHDKLGQKLFSESLTIRDNVYHPLSKGLPFDFEGMPRQKVNLIENGVFKELVLDRKLGAELNQPSTGHSLPQPNPYGPLPLNLVMEQGNQSTENMIKSTAKGLYVNRFHYTNLLDPMTLNLTGMTRDGLFLIENGEITKPVKNFRFTESLINTFNTIEAIENKSTFIQAFFGGGFVVSGMKLGQFHFSSKTNF